MSDQHEPLWDSQDGFDELSLPDDPNLRGGLSSGVGSPIDAPRVRRSASRPMAGQTSVPPPATPSSGRSSGFQSRPSQASWPIAPSPRARSPYSAAPNTLPPRMGRRKGWRGVTGTALLVAIVVGVVSGYAANWSSGSDSDEAVFDYGEQWTAMPASMSQGLVRVMAAGSVEADGIVMQAKGAAGGVYVATSLSRFADVESAAELELIPDGQPPVGAAIVGFDATKDVLVLRETGASRSSLPNPAPVTSQTVDVDDDLILLDDQGEYGGDDLPVTGYNVQVEAVKQRCTSQAAELISNPLGFTFSVEIQSAEPGGAVIDSDGKVAGMFYGGDDPVAGVGGGTYCAVPIKDVQAVVDAVAKGTSTGTVHIGEPGSLGVQLMVGPSAGSGRRGTYPEVAVSTQNGPAFRAGVRQGDRLVRVGKTSLKIGAKAGAGPDGVIQSLTPGDKVEIEWQSRGKTKKKTVTVVAA